MAKRLQVIIKDPEYREIQRAARARHLSIAEWVRQALVAARQQEPTGSVTRKLEAIRRAAQYEFPAADIDQMLAEIEQGYTGGPPA
jgi:hypothetical protein